MIFLGAFLLWQNTKYSNTINANKTSVLFEYPPGPCFAFEEVIEGKKQGKIVGERMMDTTNNNKGNMRTLF